MPVIYGDRAHRHGHHQHSVWLLDVAMGVCRALGAERLFPGLGSPVCARLLNAGIHVPSAAVGGHYGTRRITSARTHSHCDGSERAALRLACRDDDCWLYGDSRGDFSLLAATQSPAGVAGLPAVGEWRHDALEIAQQQEGAGLTRKRSHQICVAESVYLAAFVLLCAGLCGPGGDQRLGQFVYVRRWASIWSRRIRQ